MGVFSQASAMSDTKGIWRSLFHKSKLYHFTEFLAFFQSQGISIVELSEQAIEASNYDSKQNVLQHSYMGSYAQQNLDCFRKSWWVSDPCILY